MPENQSPATQPEPAGEFNFANSDTETPRIKKRTLKTKVPGLIKPNPAALPAARELEREAPPVTAEKSPKPASVKTEEIIAKAKTTEAPPRSIPLTSVTATTTSATPKIATTATPTAGPASSPHGTRPATLYYTSPTKKTEPAKAEPAPAKPTPAEPSKAEMPTPMKTIPTASAASTGSAQRVSTTATTPGSRPSVNVDYRANVERQSREQKSVGSILSYIVYGLIAFFVISAGLAGYGAHIIFKQLGDQSVTASDLDKKYADANAALTAKLATTTDALSAAQSQISRQQDVIVKQQEELNQLIASSTANEAAIKAEKAARAQETATIRARLKEVEYKQSTQKY